MLFLIILSALLFDAAFFFSDVCGFLILFVPIPLFIWLCNRPYSIFDGVRAGLLWGVLVFGAHFTWLWCLMVQHSAAQWWLCGLVYGAVVGYFSLWSCVWLGACVVVTKVFTVRDGYKYGEELRRSPTERRRGTRTMNTIFSIIFFSLITLVFTYSLEHWSLKPLGIDISYPFINPRIPLAPYQWFVPINQKKSPPSSFAYVPPVANRIKNVHASWRCNPEGVGQKIFHMITDVVSEHQMASLFLAPESFFSFPLNECPHLVTLWTTALPPNALFLLGSILHDEKGYYQAAFCLREGLIINFYVKKILAPFTEKVPLLWNNVSSVREAFLGAGSVEFLDHSTRGAVEYFDIGQSLRVIPRVCLEFFFMTRQECERYQTSQRKIMVAWFVNDSWFNEPFRQIMHNLARLKAYELGFPVLMIGHFGMMLRYQEESVLPS